MVECDYCDASFADEDDYLAHLRDAHEGELGSIDQRRVEDLDGDDSAIPTGPAVLGVVLVVALGLVAYLTLFGGSDGVSTDIPNRGDDAVISQVQTEQSTGNTHVSPGTNIDYERTPPTSGNHYPAQSAPRAGFYEEPQPYGGLVHSIEHGAIVVYYDPDQLSPEAEEHLTSMAQTYTGAWQSFIAVPNPEDDPEAAYVLTAWEKRLTMDEYDPNTVRQFTGEYLGRGPENPVR